MEGQTVANRLLSAIIPFAEQMVCDHGEFLPYGGIVTADGKIVDVGAEVDGCDFPSAREVLEVLYADFRQRACRKEITAAAVVFDVQVTDPRDGQRTDAIEVNLETSDGYTAEVFKPYGRTSSGEVTFSTLFAQEGASRVFA